MCIQKLVAFNNVCYKVKHIVYNRYALQRLQPSSDCQFFPNTEGTRQYPADQVTASK